jgi:hypothetical protein
LVTAAQIIRIPFATTLSRQVGLVAALQLFAAAVLGGPLLATGTLINDRAADFYFFRDTLHSLNVHGEFPWWNPSIWAGFPAYYINFLYWPGREPLFSVIALAVWVLGRLEVTIPSYHALYVAYLSLFVPLLLSLGVLALARQVLRRPSAVYFVIVLMAFSPGVVLSLSDLGTEVTAYGFLWAAAWLHYVRKPGRGRFAALALASVTVCSALTYFALIWVVFFIPACAVAVCVGRRGLAGRSAPLRAVPLGWWVATTAGMVLCALPTVIVYSHGADILSTRAQGERYYAYEALRPGNPLEALAVSTPGVGFEWTDYRDPQASFQPWPISPAAPYATFGYMGMLTLPLVCLGLVYGRRYWAVRLWAGIGAVITIAMLSAFSPIFSLALGLPSPLRGVNHYSDLVMRLGLFALLALAAGLGVESLWRSAPARRWTLVGLFAASAAASILWLIRLHGPGAPHNFVFGLALALALLYAVGLWRLALARTPSQMAAVVFTLFGLMLIDTSTLAFAHLRLSLARASQIPIEPGPDTIGSVIGREETDFLYLRGLRDPALVDQPGPVVTLASAGHDGTHHAARDVEIVAQTYNRLAVRVRTTRPDRLEWRDAYFPFWRASVNGADAPVERTHEGMKSVQVPAGESSIDFRFDPTWLRAATAAAYLAWTLAAAVWLLGRRAQQRFTDVPSR